MIDFNGHFERKSELSFSKWRHVNCQNWNDLRFWNIFYGWIKNVVHQFYNWCRFCFCVMYAVMFEKLFVSYVYCTKFRILFDSFFILLTGPDPSRPAPPPSFPQKWPYLHERCAMCWNEWKVKFMISNYLWWIFVVKIVALLQLMICRLLPLPSPYLLVGKDGENFSPPHL